MNIQILPYIFKRIGLFLFILGPIGHFLMGFFDPFQSDDKSGFPVYWSTLLSISSLLGIILYFISKEKVEDELVKKVRLESMSMAFLFSVSLLLLITIISFPSEYRINAELIFYLQLFLFLIIYYYKKRNFSL